LPVLPTVWIFDDALAMHADRLVIDFLGSAAHKYGHQRWTCAQCGENLEGQLPIAGSAARRGRNLLDAHDDRAQSAARATRSWPATRGPGPDGSRRWLRESNMRSPR
jgi:hypothetical protein